jgi:putative transcriptional regulator
METMQHINHHLTDALVLSYATGNLPEAFNLVIATHISLCDECRARLETYETVGGALIDYVDLATMSEGALDATMAAIEALTADPVMVEVQPRDAVFPAPLRDYVGGDLDDVTWRSIGAGVRQAVLETSKDATVRLLSIPGGAAMPDHGHRGMELTLVLKGAFRDEDIRFARGDIEIANEDLHHTPIAEEGEPCICLAATDAPLRFRGLLPRLAQPFIGI